MAHLIPAVICLCVNTLHSAGSCNLMDIVLLYTLFAGMVYAHTVRSMRACDFYTA